MSTPSSPKAPNATKINWWVDVGLFFAIWLALAPAFTGLPVHEWLSLALALAAIVHLLLHWAWLETAIRRVLGRLPNSTRINFVLNTLLFINFVIVTFTGVLISRAALPLFGFTFERNGTWSLLHRLSADLIVFIVGLHIALHWRWLWNAVKRYLAQPLSRLVQPAPKPIALPVAIPLKSTQPE